MSKSVRPAKMPLQLAGAGVELNVLVREGRETFPKPNKKAPEPRKPQGQQDVCLGRPNGLQKNVSPFSASIP